MEATSSFNTITYKTADGETIQATKNNGIVTLNGDKNGVRQLPLEDFKKEFLATAPQLERVPSADTVDLSQNKIPEEQSDKKPASTAKKIGVGVGSFIIPGLGQAINKNWGKAAGFFFGSLATTALIVSNPILGTLASGALKIWSTVDAVKNAKSK